ncbi:hypothetical protein Trydic_g22900 [Trypoxylus dichotomus]
MQRCHQISPTGPVIPGAPNESRPRGSDYGMCILRGSRRNKETTLRAHDKMFIKTHYALIRSELRARSGPARARSGPIGTSDKIGSNSDTIGAGRNFGQTRKWSLDGSSPIFFLISFFALNRRVRQNLLSELPT